MNSSGGMSPLASLVCQLTISKSGTGLSALIYGNFSDLLIGMFGQLEILVDPYTDFAKGTVGVRALQSIDIAVRHAESFAAMQDAIA